MVVIGARQVVERADLLLLERRIDLRVFLASGITERQPGIINHLLRLQQALFQLGFGLQEDLVAFLAVLLDLLGIGFLLQEGSDRLAELLVDIRQSLHGVFGRGLAVVVAGEVFLLRQHLGQRRLALLHIGFAQGEVGANVES